METIFGEETNENEIMNYSFEFNEPIISEIEIDGEIYHKIMMENLDKTGDINKPIVPFKVINIIIPQEYDVSTINVDVSEKISLGEYYNIELGKAEILNIKENKIININSKNSDDLSQISKDYQNTKIINYDPVEYPDSLYDYELQHYHGYSILILNLYPLHYISNTGEIYYYDQMDVTITNEYTGEVNEFYRDGLDEYLITNQLNNYFVDYSMINTYTTSYGRSRTSTIVDPSDTYEYVIITTDALKNANGEYTLQDLRDYKQLYGTSCKIVTVEEIESCSEYDWNGEFGDRVLGLHFPFFDDTQCHIRNFIKDAYCNWETNYVLLAADDPDIPARNLYCVSLAGIEHVPSDLYYACLDRSFNPNMNGKWGQLVDFPDIFAEVYVGRACCDNEDEVSNFVKKTIQYAETPTTEDYISNVVMVGEHIGFGGVAEYAGNYLDEMIDGSSANGYTTIGIPSELYDVDTLYDRDWYNNNWPKSEIINYINDGVHIVDHLGHGFMDHALKMNNNDINSLTNTNPCFIYSQTCLAGAFDNPQGYDCFAEEITVGTDKGAFAAIMNTRYGLGKGDSTDGPSQRFARWFFDGLYGESQDNEIYKEIGPSHFYSKIKNANSFIRLNGLIRWVYYTSNIFGDPQLKIKIPIVNELCGYVRDLDTNQPIYNAQIDINTGDTTYTTDTGYWEFKNIRSGIYDINVYKNNYQSYQLNDIEINDDLLMETIYLQHEKGYVEGYVRDDETYQPIQGVTVSSGEIEAITNSYGYYFLTLNTGTQTLNIEKNGYSDDSYDINVVVDDITNHNFYMFKHKWITPTSYSDTSNDWNNEEDAYDGSTSTKADYEIIDTDWHWTGWLYLYLDEPTVCNKVRFYAWYNILYIDEIELQVWCDGGWHYTRSGVFDDREWELCDLGTGRLCEKVRVRFKCRHWWLYPGDVHADLNEVQFYKIEPNN